MTTIYLTKEVSVDTEVEVEVEVELDEVIDGNEDEVLDYLLTSGHREFVESTIGESLIDDEDFVKRVKEQHGLLTHDEAKDMFHVEQPVIVPEPPRSSFLMGSDMAFRVSEDGILARFFELHDGQVAVRLDSRYGGGYFTADRATAEMLLQLLPPPPPKGVDIL